MLSGFIFYLLQAVLCFSVLKLGVFFQPLDSNTVRLQSCAFPGRSIALEEDFCFRKGTYLQGKKAHQEQHIFILTPSLPYLCCSDSRLIFSCFKWVTASTVQLIFHSKMAQLVKAYAAKPNDSGCNLQDPHCGSREVTPSRCPSARWNAYHSYPLTPHG